MNPVPPRHRSSPKGKAPLEVPDQIDAIKVLTAAILATGVGFGAWRVKSLTKSGAIAAGLVGTVTVAGAGWLGGMLLAAFFVSSSLLSAVGKPSANRRISQRGSQRDAVQVLANGGVPGLIAVVALLDPRLLPFALVGIAGALAAATADTWATEIGRRSRIRPRKVTTGEYVAPGMSGGVTPLGTGASLAGAAFIALVAQIFTLPFGDGTGFVVSWPGFLTIAMAGFGGSLADSFAGATLQALYVCDGCQTVTESPIHDCGQPTKLIAGFPAVTNDVVNLIATMTGALIALAVAVFAW